MRDSINMACFVQHVRDLNIDVLTIVDAGSMDGNDARVLLKEFPTASAYAIEALPDNFDNIHIQGVVTIPACLNSFDGTVTFHQKNINGIHGIYSRTSHTDIIVHTLPCYTLSTIINKYNIHSIDVLKIDVEGATLDVLKGLTSHDLNNIKIMHIETETYEFFKGQTLQAEVFQFLNENGFVLKDITYVEILPRQYQSDSVWVNKSICKFGA